MYVCMYVCMHACMYVAMYVFVYVQHSQAPGSNLCLNEQNRNYSKWICSISSISIYYSKWICSMSIIWNLKRFKWICSMGSINIYTQEKFETILNGYVLRCIWVHHKFETILNGYVLWAYKIWNGSKWICSISSISIYCDLQNNCKFDRPSTNAWMRGIPIQGPFFVCMYIPSLQGRAVAKSRY